MFASKEACVREIAGRVLDSRLNDEGSISAVFNLIKAYRENPRAFGDYRDTVEPLDITAAFQWDETDPEWLAYWQNVNSALVGVFHEMSEGCDYQADEAGDGEGEFIEVELEEALAEALPTTYYDAIGPMVEGWGLFDKAEGKTLPLFCESRQEARDIKSDDDKVVRVAMFTIAE